MRSARGAVTLATAGTALAAVAIALSSCGTDERAPAPAPPVRTNATTVTAQPPQTQDTGFGGTTSPVARTRSRRPGVTPPMLRAVETSRGPGSGYDRIVFEFTGDSGSPPGYRIEYTTGPVQRCGSGDPVAVAGAARLVVRFEPAQAHDERGNPAPPPATRHSTPALPAVRELTLICDFEGQVEWVLGVAARTPYRISELSGPARLVLDVKHGP